MTHHDLAFHPAYNHHSRLTFHDGSQLSGVYCHYFFHEPKQLYLVRSTDLIAFKPLMDAGDAKAMRRYCVPIDPEEVEYVEHLD